MMMECPKCGFSQPEDPYCANCGLEISYFNPEPVPFFQKLFRSNGFLVFSMLFVIIFMVFAIFWSQKEEPELNSDYAAPISEKTHQNPPPSPARPKARPSKTGSNAPARIAPSAPRPTPRSSARSGRPPNTNEAFSESQAAPSDYSEDNDSSEKQAARPRQLYVRFAEIKNEALSEFLTKTQTYIDSPDFSAYTYPYKDSLMSLEGFGFLAGSQNFTLSPSDKITLDFPKNQAADEPGMHLQIVPNLSDPSSTLLELTTEISYTNESGDDIFSTFSETFSLPNDHILLIVGVMPKYKPKKESLNKFVNSPLSILASDMYLRELSEFVILFQLK